MTDRIEPTLDVGDYWAILKRRSTGILVLFGVVLGASLALAFLLPPTYRSEATILIQRQTIPSNVVATTVDIYVQEQIEEIRQRITSYDNLLDIAESFDLYPAQRKSNPDKTVNEVEENIEVEMVDVKATDPNVVGDRVATIAFTVAFNANDPKTARAVAVELTNRFLEGHKAAREAQAAEVSDFLEIEAERLKLEITKLEKLQADFKQREQNQLPELKDMNLRLYERTEQDIVAAREAIRQQQEKIDAAEAELSLTEPYKEVLAEDGKRVLTATDRLNLLTAEFLRDSARYSPEHPDIVRLSREIRILAQQAGTGGRADQLMGQLTKLQEQLRQARQTYSDDHPEVLKLEKAVAAVERGFQSVLAGGINKSSTPVVPPDNPRYVALRTQRDAARSSLTAEKQKLEMLQSKLVEYESRLFQTPAVERDYKTLSRDYDNAVNKYADIKNKQLEARIAQQLESGDSAEQFVLLSGANLPATPDSPNRIGIMLLGGLLAFAAGLGYAAVMEHMDRSVRDVGTIFDVFGAPPLVVVPQMSSGSALLLFLRTSQ